MHHRTRTKPRQSAPLHVTCDMRDLAGSHCLLCSTPHVAYLAEVMVRGHLCRYMVCTTCRLQRDTPARAIAIIVRQMTASHN